jgi:hypothetical protein
MRGTGMRLDARRFLGADRGQRIASASSAFRCVRHYLCVIDLDLRRIGAIHRSVAHARDRQSACAGVLHDRRGDRRPDCSEPDAGERADQSRVGFIAKSWNVLNPAVGLDLGRQLPKIFFLNLGTKFVLERSYTSVLRQLPGLRRRPGCVRAFAEDIVMIRVTYKQIVRQAL